MLPCQDLPGMKMQQENGLESKDEIAGSIKLSERIDKTTRKQKGNI